jgi:hypothetical protein
MWKKPPAHASEAEALVTITAGIRELARGHFVIGTDDRNPFLLVARDCLTAPLDAVFPDWRERLLADVEGTWEELDLWGQMVGAASALRGVAAGLRSERRLTDAQRRWLPPALESAAKASALLKYGGTASSE